MARAVPKKNRRKSTRRPTKTKGKKSRTPTTMPRALTEDMFLSEIKRILSRREATTTVESKPATLYVGPLGAGGAAKLSRAIDEKSIMGELRRGYESMEVKLRAVEIQVGNLPKYNTTRDGPLTEFSGLEGYKEVDRYWVQAPYSIATILYNDENKEYVYHLVEPALNTEEARILEDISEPLERALSKVHVAGQPKERILAEEYERVLKKTGHINELSVQGIYKIWYYLMRNYVGYGEIQGLMADPNIEDISCNGPGLPIFLYHRRYSNIRTNLVFKEAERLNTFVATLAEKGGKMISLGRPTIDATLPEGSRLQATYGDEITTRGSSFTIRKFAKEPFTPTHLLANGTYSPEMLAYLWMITENRKNVIIIGGTASGKTSTLNTIAMFIPPAAKIVTLEETRELTLYQDNWIPNVSRDAETGMKVSLFDLLKQALRQRPEVMIVGEVRGVEGQTLFQAMSTGHTVYSTMHASTIQEMVNRLEAKPIEVPHQMITAVNVVVIQSIVQIGKKMARRAVGIYEIIGMDPVTGGVQTNEIFRWNPGTDKFERVGDSIILREIMEKRGMTPVELGRELKMREDILRYLHEKNIRNHEEVSLVMRTFYTKPNELIELIRPKKSGER